MSLPNEVFNTYATVMRLEYDTSIPSNIKALVLVKPDNWRVELHIKDNNDSTFTLVTLAGSSNCPVQRCLSQGVFQSREQAVAATRAIAASLKREGFTRVTDQPAIWSLIAQQEIKQLRAIKEANRSDYTFDPKDVFF